MKQIVFLVVVLTHFISSYAQDKDYLAKVEFQLAEEALAAKKYQDVSKHLGKAIQFLGESNSKIDYLNLYSLYDYLQNPSVNENNKRQTYLDLHEQTQKYLIDYAENPNEKYAEVYRWQSEIEPKVKELKNDYINWYRDARSFRRTIDSLNYLQLTNWFQEKMSLDGVWRLGRTYDAIVSHYKNSVGKKLQLTSKTTTKKANTFTGYNYSRNHFKLTSGFQIPDLSTILPDKGAVKHNGETFYPRRAWFNSSSRLYAIEYLRETRPNRDFAVPLENSWTYGSKQWRRYVAGNTAIIEYFNYEKSSGLWLIYPIDHMDGGDADGNNPRSVTRKTEEPYSRGLRYFKSVFGYNTAINIQGVDAGQNSGSRVTKVLEGGAAEAGGLQENDVITRVGYSSIFTFQDLLETVFFYRPGEFAEIEFIRNGEKRTTEVRISNL